MPTWLRITRKTKINWTKTTRMRLIIQHKSLRLLKYCLSIKNARVLLLIIWIQMMILLVKLPPRPSSKRHKKMSSWELILISLTRLIFSGICFHCSKRTINPRQQPKLIPRMFVEMKVASWCNTQLTESSHSILKTWRRLNLWDAKIASWQTTFFRLCKTILILIMIKII